MKTVRLRTKQSVGPLHITRRGTDGRVKERFDFTLDNGFTTELPQFYWEDLKEKFLDRRFRIRYKDALVEL